VLIRKSLEDEQEIALLAKNRDFAHLAKKLGIKVVIVASEILKLLPDQRRLMNL
jgi:homospermidine synthase